MRCRYNVATVDFEQQDWVVVRSVMVSIGSTAREVCIVVRRRIWGNIEVRPDAFRRRMLQTVRGVRALYKSCHLDCGFLRDSLSRRPWKV